MPITQNRMIALISIGEKAQSLISDLEHVLRTYDPPEGVATALGLILSSGLSVDERLTLAREAEHFARAKRLNEKERLRQARRRGASAPRGEEV